MEKTYKLKEQVKPYFDADYHEREMSINSWHSTGITSAALEEVKFALVTVGADDGENGKNISRWDMGAGGFIYFTVNLPDIGVRDFDRFCENKAEIAERFEFVVNEMFNNNFKNSLA